MKYIITTKKLTLSALIGSSLIAANSQSLNAQTVRSWNSTSGGTWTSTTNWSPTGTFAGGAPLANPTGEGANTDIFSVVAANAASNVGINMNTLAAAGGVGLILGGIDINKTNTTALQIGNNSTSANGLLQINASQVIATVLFQQLRNETAEDAAALLKHESLPAMRKLIKQRQYVLRDALLSETKYLRPGIAKGLPMNEAEAKAAELRKQIEEKLLQPAR